MHLDTLSYITGRPGRCQKKRRCDPKNCGSACENVGEAQRIRQQRLPPAIPPTVQAPPSLGYAWVLKQSVRQQHSSQGHWPFERPKHGVQPSAA